MCAIKMNKYRVKVYCESSTLFKTVIVLSNNETECYEKARKEACKTLVGWKIQNKPKEMNVGIEKVNI